jgi:hypothetical protein
MGSDGFLSRLLRFLRGPRSQSHDGSAAAQTDQGRPLDEINRRWLARRRVRTGADGGSPIYFGGEGGEGGDGGGGDGGGGD